MKTLLTALALGSFMLVALPASAAKNVDWAMKATWTDSCSCNASCPCIFGSAPTHSHCEGAGLMEIEKGHYGRVKLDGVKVVVAYRGGKWIKYYVDKSATRQQRKAAAKLLPAAVDFFAGTKVLETKSVPVKVERTAETVKYSVPNTSVEIKVMKGANGKPMKHVNTPVQGFPFPAFVNHTQYKSVQLVHEGGEQKFTYAGTNGFTAEMEASSKE